MPLFCFCCLPMEALWIVLFFSGFSLHFSSSPFGIPYCHAWTPLEERYPGAFVISKQNKNLGSYPVQMKEGLKSTPSGWKDNNRPALAAGHNVYISPRYIRQSAVRTESVIGWWFCWFSSVWFLFFFWRSGWLSWYVYHASYVFPVTRPCHDFGLFLVFLVFCCMQYDIMSVIYVTSLIWLAWVVHFCFSSADIPYIPGFELHCSSDVHKHSRMALVGSATYQSHQLTQTVWKKGSKNNEAKYTKSAKK